MLLRKSNQTMDNVIKEIKSKDAQCYQGNQTNRNIEADFRRYLNIIVAISVLTLDKEGNKDFCQADVACQTEMFNFGHL